MLFHLWGIHNSESCSVNNEGWQNTAEGRNSTIRTPHCTLWNCHGRPPFKRLWWLAKNPPRRHHGRYLTTLESQESMLISHNHIYVLDLARPRSIEVQFPLQIPVRYKAMNGSQHNCISTK